MTKVEQCDAPTQEAFKRLAAFIGTDEYKRMKRLPDAITFHYLTEAVQQAIMRQANTLPDCIVDSIIVRDAIGLAPAADVRQEVDKFALRLQAFAEDLVNFSGYFICRYCSRS